MGALLAETSAGTCRCPAPPVWHSAGLQRAVRPDLCRRALEGLPLISRVIFWLLLSNNGFKGSGVCSTARPHKVSELHILLLYGLHSVRVADGGN